MSRELDEAIVLRGVDFGETSRIVTFLTPRRGRLACIAKGVRRKNSPLASALDTFNRLELLYFWKEGRQVHPLAEASVLDDYRPLKQDAARMYHAAWPLEVAGRVAHENEPSAPLFSTLVQGLEHMAHSRASAPTQALWLVLHLLDAAGFSPELGQCVHCGAEDAARWLFSEEGGLSCNACGPGRRMSAAAWDALRDLQAAASACPEDLDAAAVREAFDLIAQYAAYQLEGDFRSVRVLRGMFG